jgi:hypothetical protein
MFFDIKMSNPKSFFLDEKTIIFYTDSELIKVKLNEENKESSII